jgi:tetratricopeptide (TPR) repeat protein
MKAWLAGVMLALLVMLGMTAFVQADDSVAQQAFARGDFKTAKVEYFSIAAHNPDDGLAWLGLGRSCAQLEDWVEALAAFKRAATLGALDSASHVEYGDLLKQQGELDAAIEQYQLALALASGDAPVGPKTATKNTGSPAAADPDKTAVKVARPAAKPQPASRKAGIISTAIKTDSAINVAQTSPKSSHAAPAPAKAEPVAAQAADSEAAAPAVREVPVVPKLAPVGSDTAAKRAVKPGAQLAPAGAARVEFLAPFEPRGAKDQSQSQTGMVQMFHEQRPSGALQDTKSATQPQDAAPAQPADLLAQARDLAASKRWAEAVTAYEALMQQQAVTDDVRLEYSAALREAGDLQKAEDEFNRLLHANPDSIEAKIGLAKVLGKNAKITEAMYLLDQIFVDRSTYAKVQLARAYIYFVNDYVSEAISMIGEVQGYDPENAEAKEMLAEYSAKLDETMGWNKPGPLPDDPSLRGEVQYNQGERELAKSDFEKAVRANPGDMRAWQRLASLYRWDEQWDEAGNAYLRYLKLNPTDYDARLRYAQVLLSSGDAAGAHDELWSLITDPSTPIEVYNEALLAYATALTALGQSKDAITWYEQALRFDPHNAGARTAFAGALASARQYDKAREQYLWVLEDDPGSQAARLGMAQTYAWSGDLRNAIKYYDEIDQTSDYHSASLIGKAFAYLWAGKRDKAVALAQEAGRVDPKNPDLPTLYARLNEKPDPVLAATWRQSHDSEDNDYVGLTTTVSVPLNSRGTTLGILYEDLKLDNTSKNQSASGSNTKVTLTMPVGDKVRIGGSVSKLNLSNSNSTRTDKWNWSANGSVQLNEAWTVFGSYEDSTLYDTPELVRNQIGVGQWAVGSDWRLPDGNTHLVAQYAYGQMSDHNSRESRMLKLARSAVWENRARIDYGIDYRTLDYSWDLTHGYWDPDNYRIYETFVDYNDTSSRRIKLDGSLGWGLQKNTNTKYASVFRYNVGLRAGFHNDRWQLRAGYSNSNAQDTAATVPGYQWKSWYLSTDFRF